MERRSFGGSVLNGKTATHNQKRQLPKSAFFALSVKGLRLSRYFHCKTFPYRKLSLASHRSQQWQRCSGATDPHQSHGHLGVDRAVPALCNGGGPRNAGVSRSLAQASQGQAALGHDAPTSRNAPHGHGTAALNLLLLHLWCCCYSPRFGCFLFFVVVVIVVVAVGCCCCCCCCC